MSREPKTGDVRLKYNTRKRLSEKISGVYGTGSVIDSEEFGFNMRANEMITNVNVFGLAMVRVIDRERFCAVVVCTNNQGRRTGKVKLMERLAKPDSFLNCSCEGDVLSFSS